MTGGTHPGRIAPDIVIRRIQPSDRAPLGRFYGDLSAESRRARFLGSQAGISDAASESFCTLDHVHDEGFVAILPDRAGAEPLIVGHLCLAPAGLRRLELALAVAEKQQGCGIGRRLLEAALAWATERQFEAIVATCFADNARVLRLLTSAPSEPHVLPADGGLVDVVIPLAPEPLPDLVLALPAQLRARGRDARRRGRNAVSRPCRVVWRRTRPPGPGAAD